MRALKCAAFAVAIVVGLTTSPANAATARSLSLSVPAGAGVGVTASFSGTLTNTPVNSTVQLQLKSTTSTSFSTVATAKTKNAAGAYSGTFVVPKSLGTYTYRAYAPKTTTRAAAFSPSRIVRVRVYLTASSLAPAPDTSVTFSGRVLPWVAKTPVMLQRRLPSSSTYTNFATLTPNASGAFSKAFKPWAELSPSQQAGLVRYYRVVVTAYGGYPGATTLPLTVKVSSPTIATALPDGLVNTSYAETVKTIDNRPGTWAVSSGALPNPLSLDTSTGAITGTPTAAGTSPFTLQFTDIAGQVTSRPYKVTIDPVVNPNVPAATQMAAGNAHACRIKADLTLQCWGWNVNGQVGNNSFDENIYFPQPIGPGWAQVSPGHFSHTCGVKADYSLWCWGNGSNGSLGNGEQAYYRTPQPVAAGTHWKQATAGSGHSCAIRTDGSLWCWGQQQASALVPGPINPGTTWTQVDAGNGYTCGIQTDQSLWCWGANANGGWLGNGTTNVDTVPTKVGTSAWLKLATGQGHTCGIKTDTTLWCWGKNSMGSVGDNTTADALAPTQEFGHATGWASVSANGSSNFNHTCATKTDNTLWCWGSGTFGEIGDGADLERDVPVQVAGTDWASVAVGGSFTCATKTVSGDTYCWGANNNGQVGQNAPGISKYSTPIQVPN